MHSYFRSASHFRTLYARRLLAMSQSEALTTLGFPPQAQPSPTEIAKAYKALVFKHHPDRGGSHEQMVEISAAKAVLDKAKAVTEEDLRAAFEEKRRTALYVIDQAGKGVANAAEEAVRRSEIGRGKLHLRDFFSEELAEAIDKMQDEVETGKATTPDMRKADALCKSIANKALRLGKRYLTLLKLQGEATASLLAFSGSDSVDANQLTNLYAETGKFIVSFTELWQESRTLVGLINTSEEIPSTWDDIYYHCHNILDAFVGDFKRWDDQGLKRFKQALSEAVPMVRHAVMSVAPEEWKDAPSADRWGYPSEFIWARGVVVRAHQGGTKNASYAR